MTATNKQIQYIYDETSNVASVDNRGLVTFYKKGSFFVYLTATDGSGVVLLR